MSLVRFPSPVAALLAAVAGGTALGLLLPHSAALAGAALAVAIGSAVRWPATLVWIVAVGLGIGHGIAARAEDAKTCRARLSPGPVELTMVLEEPTAARAIVLATPIGPSCRGSIAVRWQDPGGARAGQVMAVEGRWTVRPG